MRKSAAGFIGLGFLGLAAPAFAVPTETLSLAIYDGSGTPAAGPYGTVTLDQLGGNVQVTVSLQSPGMGFVDTGAGQALLFDLSAPSISSSGLTSGYSFDSMASGNIHADGSGYWDYGISCAGVGGACGSGGSSPTAGPLSFTLDNVTIGDFVPNGSHSYFASDLCIGVSISGGCGVTGDVVANTAVHVPEPPGLALFGAGLMGLWLFAGRKRRPAQSRARSRIGRM